MKFYIQSKSTGNVIVTANSIQEAQDLACAYEDNHLDEAIILDEEGNLVDDWFDFVYDIVACDNSGCQKMDLDDATITLGEWKEEGVEVPAGLTAEALQYIFNEAIVDLDKLYEECIRENDEAEYAAEIRDAASYDPEAPAPIEDENPADKEYLLKTVCDDIKQASVKTGKQIADIYEMDQIAGIYAKMEVWDLDTMKRISLLDLVEPILSNKRWMEQEYRDYCDNVNEYGYDFEGRDE